jgi:hypothetical protein
MTRDEFLTTEVLKECWHEWGFTPYRHNDHNANWKCNKCGITALWEDDIPAPNDFSTWEGFGKLWEAAQKDEQWIDFLMKQRDAEPTMMETWAWTGIIKNIINPDRFATAWAKFKGWEEGP